MIAFHAANGRVDAVEVDGSEGKGGGGDAVDGELAGFFGAHDAAFSDVLAAGLKLRLDEQDKLALPGGLRRGERGEDGGQDERGGDEGDVHGDQANRLGGERVRLEQAGVGALHEGDAGVAAERVGDLAVAGVDGKDAGRAVLEEAVGEASGGGADVQAGEVLDGDRPVGEGAFELQAAAADVAEVVAEQAEDGVGGDRGSRLVDALDGFFRGADQDASGEDEGLGAFAGLGVSSVNEEFI